MSEYKYPKQLRLARKVKDRQERADVKGMWVGISIFGKYGGNITWCLFALPHLLQMQLDRSHSEEMAHMKQWYKDDLIKHRRELGLPT